MIADKLTNQDMKTRNNFQWKLGEYYETSGEGNLCSDGWLHLYEHPLLAVLHNPIHANIKNPRLFEVEVDESKPVSKDGQIKMGAARCRLMKEIPMPVVTTAQKVRYGILCTKEVCSDEAWNKWAINWLNGSNRSAETAWYAAEAAAARAAWAAADAAKAAAEAAAARAAWAVADGAKAAAEYAAWAAEYAARAADEAVKQNKTLDLIKIAKKAIAEEKE